MKVEHTECVIIMRLEASTAHIWFWFPCCIQLCEKWLEEMSDVTLAKVFPKVKCSNSLGTADVLTLHHGQGDCRSRSSLPHVCAKGWHLQMAWRLMGSRRVSLHFLKEGGVLPSPRASHIFSLYVGGFQAQVNWQCHSCGVGQKVKDGLQPPSSFTGGRILQAVCSFLMVGGSTEMAGCLALHCLATSHSAKVNLSACPKGLVQNWAVKNSMKSSSRGT